MKQIKMPVEPFRIKVVEPIRRTSKREREEALRKAGLNIFQIPAEKVFIDLLTDSGTSAMSDNQWSGMMIGDESYAGAKNFFNLEEAVRAVFGYRHVIPTHQGRAAERILFEALVKKGDYVPNNIHFDTTRANIEVRGARAVNLVDDKAYDPDSDYPFKGNMDIEKLDRFIRAKGAAKIPLVLMTITNNSGGGQPVSVENVEAVGKICRNNKIPFFFDACRFAENAFFVKKRDKEYARADVVGIARKIFSFGDGATMSAKKDALVNIGGFMTLNDDDLARRLKDLLIISEGFPTYGGLAGRDLEAVARGLVEVLDEDYLEHRVSQTAYLAGLLEEAGVPFFKPVGGHAVYILADRFLPHIPRGQYPGWALTVALYREAGIRAVEIGGVMFGHKKKDSRGREEVFPKLEMVRLAIPRRVYTVSHLAYVADALARVYRQREKIRGLKIIRQAAHLRHFTAEFEEI
jgi:tyrosine phenol-lyase